MITQKTAVKLLEACKYFLEMGQDDPDGITKIRAAAVLAEAEARAGRREDYMIRKLIGACEEALDFIDGIENFNDEAKEVFESIKLAVNEARGA